MVKTKMIAIGLSKSFKIHTHTEITSTTVSKVLVAASAACTCKAAATNAVLVDEVSRLRVSLNPIRSSNSSRRPASKCLVPKSATFFAPSTGFAAMSPSRILS